MNPLKFLAKVGLLVALAASTLGTVAASPASAYTDDWCHQAEYGNYWMSLAGNNACVGPRHSYTSIVARTPNSGGSLSVCAGANLNGGQYGSYICASDWSCHTYGGSNLLNGVIWNRVSDSGAARSFRGEGTYAQGAFNGCARGTYVSANKDTQARRQLLEDSLPVFAKAQAGPKPSAAVLAEHGIVLDDDGSRSFTTASGNGWITSDSAHNEICVLLADAQDGYGLVCKRRGKALSEGIQTALISDAKSKAATSTTIVVKPGAGNVDVQAATPTAALATLVEG